MHSCLPEAFVRTILVERLRASHVVVGFNYSFGYRGAGDPQLLQQLTEPYGITVTVMEPCYVDGEIVSSSAVRNYLREGNVEKAKAMLGYAYSLEGPVLTGNQIGRTTVSRRLILGLPEIFCCQPTAFMQR